MHDGALTLRFASVHCILSWRNAKPDRQNYDERLTVVAGANDLLCASNTVLLQVLKYANKRLE